MTTEGGATKPPAVAAAVSDTKPRLNPTAAEWKPISLNVKAKAWTPPSQPTVPPVFVHPPQPPPATENGVHLPASYNVVKGPASDVASAAVAESNKEVVGTNSKPIAAASVARAASSSPVRQSKSPPRTVPSTNANANNHASPTRTRPGVSPPRTKPGVSPPRTGTSPARQKTSTSPQRTQSPARGSNAAPAADRKSHSPARSPARLIPPSVIVTDTVDDEGAIELGTEEPESPGTFEGGEGTDPATTRRLYLIADLLRLRPKDTARPTALNPPPDLKILWDGKDDAPMSAPYSARSGQGSVQSGGGSGFTTPRMSREGSSRNLGQERLSRQNSQKSGRDNNNNRRREVSPPPRTSTEEDVELLRRAEVAWKPKKMLQDEDVPVLDADGIIREAVVILNKMTLEKFDKLSDAFCNVGFTTHELVERIIATLIEKAQSEAHFSPMYAKLCLKLSETPLPAFEKETKGGQAKKMLLALCQAEFERDQVALLQAVKDDPKLSAEEKAEKDLILRRRYTGHMRFIGELYKVGLLKEKYVHFSIEELLGGDQVVPDEDKLDCMVKLMNTVGQQLEEASFSSDKAAKLMKNYFKKIQKLSEDEANVSSRLRFMLQDLIDLKRNQWIPRRDEEKAMRIDQIHEQVAREEEQKSRDSRKNGGGGRQGNSSSRSSSSYNGSGSQDVRASSSSKSKEKEAPAVSEDGWTTVPSKGSRSGNTSKQSSGPSSNSGSSRLPPRSSSSGSFAVLDEDNGRRKKKDSSKPPKSSSSKDKDKDKDSRDRNRSTSSTHSTSGSSKRDKRVASEESSRSNSNSKAKEEDASPRVSAKVQSVPELSEDDVRNRSKAAIQEFVVNQELDEVLLCIKEAVEGSIPEYHSGIVAEALRMSLEGKDKDREAVKTVLLAASKSPAVLSRDAFLKGCAEILDFLSDIVIDAPLAGTHASKLLGALVVNGALPLSFFSPTFVEESMPELLASGRAAAFAVDVLAAAQKELNDDATALQSLAAASDPPITPTLLHSLLPEDTRDIESMIKLLEIKNVVLVA